MIGGLLKEDQAITRLAEAILADNAGQDYVPAENLADAEELIREAVTIEEPLRLSATELAGGEFEEVEAACVELGLTRIATWESYFSEWDAGIRRRNADGTEFQFLVDGTGLPAASLHDIEAAHQTGRLPELLANMRQCMPDTLPPLSAPELERSEAAAPPERDDDEAIGPNGEHIGAWDERLRTVGAVRVPKGTRP